MTSSRHVSLTAGIFFLLTFVHVLIFPFYNDILNDADFILGSGDSSLVSLGALIDFVASAANVATGVILFQVLRRQHLGLSLGYVGIRVFEAAMIMTGTLCLLAIVTLREEFPGATGAQAADLQLLSTTLIAVRDWTFFFGPGICAGLGNGLVLGWLMFRSGLVPRKMALLGVVGGPLSFLGLMFVLFGQWEQDAPQQLLFTLLEIAWEFSLSIYLIVWGFRRVPIAEGELTVG